MNNPKLCLYLSWRFAKLLEGPELKCEKTDLMIFTDALLLLKRLILRLSIISVISIDEICYGFLRLATTYKKKINDKLWTKDFA